MAKIGTISGVGEVLANLSARRAEIALGVARGLKVAGLALQRESQRLVPVDFGILKASAFTRSTGAGLETEVTVGYTAGYALYVHEAVAMKLKGKPRTKPSKGKYWDPQGRAQPKFLEEPARRMAPELRAIIMAYGKIK